MDQNRLILAVLAIFKISLAQSLPEYQKDIDIWCRSYYSYNSFQLSISLWYSGVLYISQELEVIKNAVSQSLTSILACKRVILKTECLNQKLQPLH